MAGFKSMAAALAAILLTVSAPAFAVEARPWLCRDKPVFSSSQPMIYTATKHGGGRWLMTFMRFDPSGGGHDGFTLASSNILSGSNSGSLAPGQWYAVALYRSGGHWICPGSASENDEPASGVVSDLCYGEDPGSCPVKLVVRPASSSAVSTR